MALPDHGCFQIDHKTNAYELSQHFYLGGTKIKYGQDLKLPQQ